MPVPASELENDPFLRMLIMGVPKLGRTTHAVATAPAPVRVLLCEADSALRGAKQETDQFEFERIRPDANGHIWTRMINAIVLAKNAAKEGQIKTLVVDPLSFFAHKLMAEIEKATETSAGNVDGRKAHPEFTKRIIHCVDLLLTVPCHVVVVTHHMETGGDDNAERPKTGRGIVPLMPNMATRTAIAAMFYDIVWFDLAGKDTPPESQHNGRVFVTGPEGAWGTGCRSRKGNFVLPAHVGKFIEWANEQTRTMGEPASKPKLKPVSGGKR